MIKKKDILDQQGKLVHVRHDAFLSTFDNYQITVRERSVNQFLLEKQHSGLTYISFMSAAEIISLHGTEYFKRLINCIQEETA